MTTIVTDGKTMAADSRLGAETRHGSFTKIVRAQDGAILGVAGHATDLSILARWYKNFSHGYHKIGDDVAWAKFSKDFEGLILQPDGTLLAIEYDGTYFEHPLPAAIGSGLRYAYGALDAGATPEKAVEIACGRDSFSDLPVLVMALGKVD